MVIKYILPTGVLALVGLLGTPVLAQNVDTVSFPLEVLPNALVDGTFEYQPRPGAFVDLMGRQALIMTQVELPSGQLVDLDLTRVNVDFASMGVQVNGRPSPFDPLDLTLWRGQVSGDLSSDVFLSFSSHGCNGWIYSGGEYNHLMGFAGPGNDWANAGARLVPESVLISVGGDRSKLCGTDELLNGPLAPASRVNNMSGASATSLGTTFNNSRWTTLECKVSVETDYQYYQNFNNLQACQTYTATLLTEISDRYNSQLDVVLTYPYLQFYTSSNDPWTAQSGGAGAMLNEFRNAWLGNIPSCGNVAHFMSGADLNGGVAYFDALCDSNWSFGVSGNMHGGTQFPVSQSSNSWDFVVMAHEIGHNFGAPHTHDYCPPLDSCASSAGFGPCQTSRNCVSNGTVMSYCHTCSGNMNNITPYFHSTVISDMRAVADASCLPTYSGTCTADSMEPNDVCGSASVVSTGSYANLTSCGTGSDYYRLSVPDNQTVTFDISFVNSEGDIDCTLWDATCSNVLDVSASTSDSESVSWTNTTGATANVKMEAVLNFSCSAPGGDYSMAVSLDPCPSAPDDGFEENDSCVTAVPMMDGAYAGLFVSKTDSDFYELCLPAGGTLIVDALFSHGNGDLDIFLYDVGNCGGGSLNSLTQGFSGTNNEHLSWTNTSSSNTTVILEVNVYPSSPWSNCNNYDLIIAGAGANCSDPNSIGIQYCSPANANSTSQAGSIAATGSSVAADNNLSLLATQLPFSQFGYFLSSQDQTFIANPGGSQGNLCVGGPTGLGRHLSTLQNSGGLGTMSAVIDTTQIPTHTGSTVSIVAGQTYNFQCWYRDMVVVSTSNFTDATSITFQ